MRRKFIVRKVKKLFDGYFETFGSKADQDFHCFFYSKSKKGKGLRKKAMQEAINRIELDSLSIIGNFWYTCTWIPDKAGWLHNWRFSGI